MRAVVQRVTRSAVRVEGEVVGNIGKGLLAFLGIGQEDQGEDALYLLDKIINLRIFSDDAGKFNLSLRDVGGELLVVSQFTLYGDCRHGRRPNFSAAAPPAKAQALYEYFIEQARGQGINVATGKFQAMMEVEINNDGPVTVLLDSRKVF